MLDSWKEKDERNIHDDLMRVTLEIVAQCLFGAEVTDVAERVGKAMEVVTERFILNASLAVMFPFDIPVRFARRGLRALSELNRVIRGDIPKTASFHQPPGGLLGNGVRVPSAHG